MSFTAFPVPTITITPALVGAVALTGDSMSGNLGIGITPVVPLHVQTSGEAARLQTTVARGSGSCYQSFYDPTGVKGFVGFTSGSTDDMIVRNSLNANLLFSTNATERMRIDGTGRVGVGVSPSHLFHVSTSSAGSNVAVLANTGSSTTFLGLAVTNGTDADLQVKMSGVGAGTNFVSIGPSTSSPLLFNVASTERMRIDTAGRVGIGASPTSSNTNLYVLSAGGSTFRIDSSTSTGPYMGVYASNSGTPIGFLGSSTGLVTGATGAGDMTFRSENNILFAISATEVMRFDTAGNPIFKLPATPPTLAVNSQVTFNLTSNTNFRISARGSDGTTRVANITLA